MEKAQKNSIEEFNEFLSQNSTKKFNITTGKFTKQAQKSLQEKGVKLDKTYLRKALVDKINDDENMRKWLEEKIHEFDPEIEIVED